MKGNSDSLGMTHTTVEACRLRNQFSAWISLGRRGWVRRLRPRGVHIHTHRQGRGSNEIGLGSQPSWNPRWESDTSQKKAYLKRLRVSSEELQCNLAVLKLELLVLHLFVFIPLPRTRPFSPGVPTPTNNSNNKCCLSEAHFSWKPQLRWCFSLNTSTFLTFGYSDPFPTCPGRCNSSIVAHISLHCWCLFTYSFLCWTPDLWSQRSGPSCLL